MNFSWRLFLQSATDDRTRRTFKCTAERLHQAIREPTWGSAWTEHGDEVLRVLYGAWSQL